MCKPDPGLLIPGPGELLGGLLSAIRLRYVAGGLAVAGLVSFVVAHAVLLGSVLAVFVVVMAAVVAAMRAAVLAQGRARAATMATVTTRRGQGVRAITAGQRAIEAPRVVLPGQVLTAAPGERVER